MTDSDLREHLQRAFANTVQPDPLQDILRRGTRLRRARRSRRISAGVTALAAAAAVVTTAVSGGTPEVAPNAPVTLVSFAAPTFPLSLRTAPPDLGAASFSQEPDGRQLMAYRASQPEETVGNGVNAAANDGINVSIFGKHRGDELGKHLGDVMVDGHHGRLYRYEDSSPRPTDTEAAPVSSELSLEWERHDGQWVVVTGFGTYANKAKIRGIAKDLLDQPIRVPLRVRLAPAGWVVQAYKDDRILTLDDPRSDDPERSINVHVPQRPEKNFAQTTGATSSTEVRVNGRPAVLVIAQGMSMVQAQMRDGTTFILQAPAALTRAQVLDLAAAVERP